MMDKISNYLDALIKLTEQHQVLDLHYRYSKGIKCNFTSNFKICYSEKILSTKTKLQFIFSYSKNTTNFDAFHQAQKPYEIVGYALDRYIFCQITNIVFGLQTL